MKRAILAGMMLSCMILAVMPGPVRHAPTGETFVASVRLDPTQVVDLRQTEVSKGE